MKILLTGATGLVGKKLGQKFVSEGHSVVVVSRNAEKAQQDLAFPCEVIEHDIVANPLPAEHFNQIQALVHLAGETIDGRWTQEKKDKILHTRVQSSKNLLMHKPENIKIVVTASAQGFYGETGDETVDESSALGKGFLPYVCEKWEEPFQQLKKSTQTRVVIVRLGVVLSRRGGALKKLIGLFQKNVGAILGSGKQWMSWISLDDVVEIFYQSVTKENWSGVINAVTDQPVTNKEMTEILAKSLDVFQAPTVPGFVLKTALGEMSELVLGSTKVRPTFLKNQNYQYHHSDLKSYLDKELIDFKNNQSLFEAEQFLPEPPEKVFSYFAEASNLEKLTPEFLNFRIEKVSTPQVQEGSLIDYKLKIHGVPVGWKTEIKEWQPPFKFVDNQLKGPYTKWYHTHQFQPFAGGTLMTDHVQYKLPVGLLGQLVAGSFVRQDVQKIFDYRRKVIAQTRF